MTSKEADTLTFCLNTPLRGRALHLALARHRGVTASSAEASVNRLIVKGFLKAGGAPANVVRTLEEVGRFLASRQWTVADAEIVMALRERIAEVILESPVA